MSFQTFQIQSSSRDVLIQSLVMIALDHCSASAERAYPSANQCSDHSVGRGQSPCGLVRDLMLFVCQRSASGDHSRLEWLNLLSWCALFHDLNKTAFTYVTRKSSSSASVDETGNCLKPFDFCIFLWFWHKYLSIKNSFYVVFLWHATNEF